MLRSAIDTGMVDWVLPARDMPSRLASYTRVLGRLRLPPEDGPQPAQPEAVGADELEATLRGVLTYLRASTGRDFSYYKRATILRRLARRMSVNGIEELAAYLDFLRTTPAEAGGAAERPADQRHQFLPRPRRLRRARGAGSGDVRGQDLDRRGARLGAGLRHRRRGLLGSR